jgi:hypothetical protein
MEMLQIPMWLTVSFQDADLCIPWISTMMFHSLTQNLMHTHSSIAAISYNKQSYVHMYSKRCFTCNPYAAAGLESEVLIKSVIKYPCSVTDRKIGPEMYIMHLSVHKPQEL